MGDPHNKGDSLTQGGSLGPGDYLMSKNGLYKLQVEKTDNGNYQLVEYGPEGQQVWSQGIHGNSVNLDATDYGLEDGGQYFVNLGNLNEHHADEYGMDAYVLQDDGNFVSYDSAKKYTSDNAVDATNKYGKDNIPNPLVAPTGASDGLVNTIKLANGRIPPLIKTFGTGNPKLPFTEATGPSASMTTILDNPVLTGSGAAYNAYQSAVAYQSSHEQQWYQNDNNLTSLTGKLAARRTSDLDQAYHAVSDCNATLRAAAIPNGKPGSIKDETPLVNAVNTAVANVQKYATDYAKYGKTLAPANAIWPDGGSGPNDVGAPAASSSASSSSSSSASTSSGTGTSSSTYWYDKGKADQAPTNTGTGTGTGNEGAASDANYNTTAASTTAPTAASTDYSSLFGDAVDGASSGSGSSLVSSSYGNSYGANYGSTYGATASSGSNSEISSLLSQLESDVANGNSSNNNSSNDDSALTSMLPLLMEGGLGKALDPNSGQGNDNNDNNNANSGDSGQNSNTSSTQDASSTQNAAAAQNQPGTAAPAAVTAPDAGTAPSTSGANHLVSVSLDGETQQVPSVVADAINKELNNPNGSNAIDAYTGTPGENSTGQPWQQLDDLSKLQTGDVVQWQDRSSLVVHDDKGLHMIVDGQIVPLTQDTTQSPPQDAYGAYGDFKGFFHPSGADLNSSANTPSAETAVANPPAVTSTQTASANPPPIAPPKQE